MLTGRKPYTGLTAMDLMQQHVSGERPPLPAELSGFEPLLSRLMARERAERYTDIACRRGRAGAAVCGATAHAQRPCRLKWVTAEPTAPELLRLRDEHALLGELLQVDRTALRNFMTYAARNLTRVRTLLQQRAREPGQFQLKLERLHTHYAQLLRRSSALSMPSLELLLGQALLRARPRRTLDARRTGDVLLPALVHIDEVFLALTTIAQRTGMPLVARRAPRRRARLPGSGAAGVRTAASGTQAPQLALALQQLAAQLAAAQGKAVELSTLGLDQVPEVHAGAFYDMLSQMLRNCDRTWHRDAGAAPTGGQEHPGRAAGGIPATTRRAVRAGIPG